MSKELGDRLPAAFQAAFDGRDLEGMVGLGYVAVTIDPDGSPRPCMLSAGEILAVDDRSFRLGLWRGTHTGDNLRARRPFVLCFVAPDTVLYVRGDARLLTSTPSLDCFEVTVTSVQSDVHEGLPVTETITFALGMDRGSLLSMWESQLKELRQA